MAAHWNGFGIYTLIQSAEERIRLKGLVVERRSKAIEKLKRKYI